MRQLRNPFVQVGLWTFAITAVVGAIVLTVPWEPESASREAGSIDTLYDVLAVVSAFVLGLVTSILIVSVVHFRKRSPDDLRDGEPIHGNTRLEAVWTAIPALLMVGAAVYSGLVLANIEESKANTQTVKVTGEQFAWTFEYEQQKLRSGELHLVEDTPYLFNFDSKDVIHSFWVPQFRMKRDAVPGIPTHVRVTPTRRGHYTLTCTELCGLGHATMRATVVVEDQAAFDRWAQRVKSGELPPPGGLANPEGVIPRELKSRMAAVATAVSGGTRRRLTGPGWIRAAWVTLAGAALAFGLVVGGRALQGYEPLFNGDAIVTVILIVAPLAFLVGIGGFDYWGRWMIGRPTQPEDHSDHGARTWKDYFRVNTDHKVIGIQYVVTALFFLFVAGGLAEVVRAELAQPGQQLVDSNTYNGLFSVHAALMIFLVVIPIFAGLANYVLPLMIGAPDMAFPRLNALSYWLLPVAGVMMLSSFLVPHSGAFSTGWTAYAPLSDHAPLGQNMFTIGVQFAGTSSIMTALNFIVTIITMRAPGMTFWRMPLLVWANFTTSLLVVIATPFVAGSQFLVLVDRTLHANFFDASQGGDVIAYQHIFWFYSHPAVYIMMLPGFGIISEVIATKARKPIFGYRLMALSLLAILILGFTVWAHHMFVSGMWNWLRVPMMITTMLIAVPTGIKIFSWLATLWKGVLELSTPMLFALGFIVMFTLGGISGIMLSAIPVDIHTSDSYFVVAHIHYVLFGGSMFTIFAGIYYWFPKMTGRMYDERLGKLHFWMTFVGFNVTFGPMHWLGIEGMPRRVADYADKFAAWNLVSSIGAFFLGAAMLVFLYNFVSSWAAGPRAPGNPWRARTLEWQVSSPPPIFNFDEIPQVVGGPYEYGVPGSVHAVLNGDREKVAVGADGHGNGAATHATNGNGHAGGGPERRQE